MTRLVTRIGSKEIKKVRMIEVGYKYLLKAEIIMQLALEKCPWRT